MEDTLDVIERRDDHSLVDHIPLDDLETGVARVLLEIAAPPDREVVENANPPTFGDQPIDQVTPNEAGPPGNQIKSHACPACLGIFCTARLAAVQPHVTTFPRVRPDREGFDFSVFFRPDS